VAGIPQGVTIVGPDKVEVRPTNLSEGDSTMTTNTMALTELAEKGADIDVLRHMVQFMAQRLMELDVEGRCGAGYDEKSPERVNWSSALSGLLTYTMRWDATGFRIAMRGRYIFG